MNKPALVTDCEDCWSTGLFYLYHFARDENLFSNKIYQFAAQLTLQIFFNLYYKIVGNRNRYKLNITICLDTSNLDNHLLSTRRFTLQFAGMCKSFNTIIQVNKSSKSNHVPDHAFIQFTSFNICKIACIMQLMYNHTASIAFFTPLLNRYLASAATLFTIQVSGEKTWEIFLIQTGKVHTFNLTTAITNRAHCFTLNNKTSAFAFATFTHQTNTYSIKRYKF